MLKACSDKIILCTFLSRSKKMAFLQTPRPPKDNQSLKPRVQFICCMAGRGAFPVNTSTERSWPRGEAKPKKEKAIHGLVSKSTSPEGPLCNVPRVATMASLAVSPEGTLSVKPGGDSLHTPGWIMSWHMNTELSELSNQELPDLQSSQLRTLARSQ